uniref:CSON004644 protein n=1 Tax=Culicoides sonorensis TaxID=179676 RepID=A0A336LFG0_CULSO
MNKTKLSKTVLQMKFMNRTREKVELEEEEAQGRNMYSSEITEKMLNGNSNIIIEPSYVICEDLIECGRFSFGGMNKDIERLMENESAAKRIKTEEDEKLRQKEMKKDVKDDEMLKYYDSLFQSRTEKFHVRRHRKDNVVGPPGKYLKPDPKKLDQFPVDYKTVMETFK